VSKLNRGPQTNRAKSFIVTDKVPTGVTGEGAPGYARDVRSELFLLAITNMTGETTFYETAGSRDDRFVALVRQVAVIDPAWMAKFIPWLRNEANMRTASIVAAIEAARAMVKAGISGGRGIVSSALVRADEPGEALAYCLNTYGRKIPKPVKRGIADAAVRLYGQRSHLKWDSSRSTVRFADVIEMTHPAPVDITQDLLFEFLLGERHGREFLSEIPLRMLQNNRELRSAWNNRQVTATEIMASVNPQNLAEAGMNWEDVLSALGNKIDKKVLWEALIPTMGYMALLRNLRNFDQAGLSYEMQRFVMAKLRDFEEVKKSRQFPFRFLAAYNNVGSLNWGPALEQAANYSLANIPTLAGRTLILVDRSGSMFDRVSEKSQLNRADSAALFGSAIALRNVGRVDLVQFGTYYQRVTVRPGDSLLKIATERFTNLGGTDTLSAVNKSYASHDRIIILTDEQTSGYRNPLAQIPANVPVYTWNLAGYRYGYAPSGENNRHVFGGLSDAAFKLIPLLERGSDVTWPWDN
jgi:hypothetical protein